MNKTKTYLLLVVVLAIWGTIGYKIINGINSNTPELKVQEFNVSFNPKINPKIDTFSIQKTNKDPFLGTLTSKLIKGKAKTISKDKKTEYYPVVSFSGVVKKQNTSDQIFVVSINNQQYLLKKGQKADSVTLINGNIKAIIVKYKNKSQSISRN